MKLHPQVKFFEKKSGRWHWNVLVHNGNLTAQCPSVGYPRKRECIQGFEATLYNTLLALGVNNLVIATNGKGVVTSIMEDWKNKITAAKKTAGRNAKQILVY